VGAGVNAVVSSLLGIYPKVCTKKKLHSPNDVTLATVDTCIE
jgi:hypothetical protein